MATLARAAFHLSRNKYGASDRHRAANRLKEFVESGTSLDARCRLNCCSPCSFRVRRSRRRGDRARKRRRSRRMFLPSRSNRSRNADSAHAIAQRSGSRSRRMPSLSSYRKKAERSRSRVKENSRAPSRKRRGCSALLLASTRPRRDLRATRDDFVTHLRARLSRPQQRQREKKAEHG